MKRRDALSLSTHEHADPQAMDLPQDAYPLVTVRCTIQIQGYPSLHGTEFLLLGYCHKEVGTNLLSLFKKNSSFCSHLLKNAFSFFVDRLSVSTPVGTSNLSMQVKIQPTYLILRGGFLCRVWLFFLSYHKGSHTPTSGSCRED